MLTPRLRERLSRLARGLGSEPPPVVEPAPDMAAAPSPPSPAPATTQPWFLHYSLETCSREVAGNGGICLLIQPDLEALLEDHPSWREGWIELEGPGWGAPEERLFLDIETAGLSAAPLFLVGTLALEGSRLQLRQWLARDYAEEAPVLAQFFDHAAAYTHLITFNGQTFDLPYLLDRAIYHRYPAAFIQEHTDLLADARRRWRGHLPDCRLATLETHICGRHRVSDVAGADIPQLYHDFVRTGSSALLAPVLQHNALDLLTMAELAHRMREDT